MKLEGEQTLLRIHVRNTDKHHWFSPTVAEALVERAKKQGLAGATVLRGFFGLDINGKILETGVWSIVDHVPLVVEIVDSPKAIGEFLPVVSEFVLEGLATLERAHVLIYRHKRIAAEKAAKRLAIPDSIHPLSTLPSAEEFPAMKLSENGQLVRIFIGESDYTHGEPLYRAIVNKALELGLAGATVMKCPMGFGAHSRMHTDRLIETSLNMPIVIEIVDSAEKVNTLLPFLDEVVGEGLVTIEEVKILKYRAKAEKGV